MKQRGRCQSNCPSLRNNHQKMVKQHHATRLGFWLLLLTTPPSLSRNAKASNTCVTPAIWHFPATPNPLISRNKFNNTLKHPTDFLLEALHEMFHMDIQSQPEYFCKGCGHVYEDSPDHPAHGEKCTKCDVLFDRVNWIKPGERPIWDLTGKTKKKD
ncbi:hypothetical protein CNAG_05281 [Cryptococcus neoformans var. grubii H99]|uniref:Uncharacterized protein n=1 Tax=Cryptococcus neoformans (strain H99 / ATCC 208821 / CBS 10515 / FGSC 9487) TaxID=235443 RepID=J9VS60_CRYN9|nr:hypothetical protein CNAG_05281 [Cryptococcus neoformans var. grubii H99]AFR94540.2 hypothetical protein CNAG_05281 [Cryptococcus neoformans var. grubii H99]AUB24208.1 hypothetical protein CKF44_05281 [Cryptococcus neoformans var. grubii]|eukprot:XP_012048573.1 hypothetical protein CNAG_05281 [Cryptococcus neoformans var. grubii H99]